MPRIRVSVEEGYGLWESKNATVVDVVGRHPYRHTRGQIKGAVQIDPEVIPERFHELPTERPVLAY